MNLQNLEDLIRASWDNSIRLLNESVANYRMGNFATSGFLAIASIEELGKFQALDKIWFYGPHLGLMGPHDQLDTDDLEFINQTILNDHIFKQHSSFRDEFFQDWARRFYESATQKEVEEDRQKFIYADVIKGRRDYRVSFPGQIHKSEAAKYINLISKHLLEQAKYVREGIVNYDQEFVNEMLLSKKFVTFLESINLWIKYKFWV